MGRVTQHVAEVNVPHHVADDLPANVPNTAAQVTSLKADAGAALSQSEHAEANRAAALKFEQQIEDDLELKSIFFEEAAEVIANGRNTVNTLLAEPNNLEAQSTLRRVFHTLKGSSRMVGLTEFGEAAWSFEQLINTKLADQTSFESDVCQLSAAALQTFSRWLTDLVANQADGWKADAFRHAADAMRFEDRLDTTGLDAPNGWVIHINEQTEPLQEEELDEPVSLLTAAVTNLPVEVVSPDSSERKRSEDHAEPELPALMASMVAEQRADTGIKPEPVKVSGLQDVSQSDSLELIDFAALGAQPIPEHDMAAAVSASSATTQSDVKAVSDLGDAPLVSSDATGVVTSHVAEPVAEISQLVPDEHEEQFKVIGSIKIGIPLYNVYLNEADEWARRLVTELDEWSMELHRPLQNSTVGLAHSLSGSSATVGFTGLAELAKLLEHALEKAYQRPNGLPQHAKLFSSAAEECHRLLHQFAAGFLKFPNEEILQQLAHFEFPEPKREVVTTPKLVAAAPLLTPPVKSNFATINPSAMPAHKVAPRSQTEMQHDDDIELVDALDIDLFHIFEEEAQELLPRLGSALRQWVTRPDNLSARSEILRTLHTLKGSSRLAGAMRLGELSHRMESEIEELGTENLTDTMLEPLLVRLDVIQSNFEGLSSPIEPETPVVAEKAALVDNKVEPAKAVKVDVPSAEDKPVSPPQELATKSMVAPAATSVLLGEKKESRQSVRVRARLLDRLVNQAGEVMLTRTRIESELGSLRGSLGDLTSNLDRLRQQLRDVEFQAETQMQSRMEQAKDSQKGFDPLEFDRFTRVQELTRMMAESVNDVATVQRSLQRTVELTEDDLVAQARQTRDLQRDLLRTRMEEFESISDRLYRVVRQASKDTGKPVKLDINGGSIEMDRGVLERMTPSFEHLLRNCVAHGIESAEMRSKSGKDSIGAIAISLLQDGNDVVLEFSDDGAGLNYKRIREQAVSQKLISVDAKLSDAETTNLIFTPGLSTASQVTELSGRGIGLDVVRAEIMALGGRIEVSSELQKGTKFKLVLPLTTAVTQVVMMRSGALSFGVPAHLVEVVRRAPSSDIQQAYVNGYWGSQAEALPFYWSGSLLQASQRSVEPLQKTNPVIVFRSAGQRIAIHVDEVFGNKEVVIKNLGPQLARLPGLAGMAILVSGAVALIYNPVALAAVYGETAREFSASHAPLVANTGAGNVTPAPTEEDKQTPLVLVVDDSITVRRVTQRMLQREGFRVVLAVDGLQALEKLAEEVPAVVLSDIEMPRMDGFDLVRNIRADARLKHLPIVMITSRIAEKHRDLAKELGVDNYLGKPYSEEGLLAVLRQHTTPAKSTDTVAG